MNFYELLEVAPSANHREIKKSYRRLLLNDGLSSKQFAVIEDAYATLIDEQLRQAYDEELLSESIAPHLLDPLAEYSRDEVELAEPATEPSKLVHETATTDTAIPETDMQFVSSRPPSKSRGRRANTNSLRTFISCVAAALAAGPIAIFILKFVFEKDPLNLWEQPPIPVTARRPVEPENIPVPVPSPTKPGINNSSNDKPGIPLPKIQPTPSDTTESEDKPGIPLPKIQPTPSDTTESEDKPGIPLPKIEPTPSDTTESKEEARMPVPTTDELEGAKDRLKRLFSEEYDKATGNANKDALAELAKKLFMHGKQVLIRDSNVANVREQIIERYAWYNVALVIAFESDHTNLVEQICESLSREYQITKDELRHTLLLDQFNILLPQKEDWTLQFFNASEELFRNSLTNLRKSIDEANKPAATVQLQLTQTILEQLQPKSYHDPNDLTKLDDILGKLFDECLTNSKELINDKHFEFALGVAELAKNIAIATNKPNRKTAVEQLINEFARFSELQKAFEAAKLNHQKTPNHPGINSAIATYTILILENWTDGLYFLAKGEDAALAKIAQKDNDATAAAIARNAPVAFSDEMKLAEQWHKLYKLDDPDINRKQIILDRTRFWYGQTIFDPESTPLHKLEIKKLLDGLQ